MIHYIHLPVVQMREAPDFASKVASEALFGERIELKDRSGSWQLIATPDGYSGWVPSSGSFIARDKPYLPDLEIIRLRAHVYKAPDTEYGPLFTLAHGTKVKLMDSFDSRWNRIELPDGQLAYIQKGDVGSEPFELVRFAKKFIGLPYTWGGRSSFGFDCSGYVQMLYQRMGIHLPRDARQQILDPRAEPISMDALVLGDLIFWGNSAMEIRHVGLYLGGGEFIHTSSRENKPYLRISRLDDFEWSGQIGACYPYRSARRY